MGKINGYYYYCTFTVSDYGFGFIFFIVGTDDIHGKSIKVLRDPNRHKQ